jgi:AcrR family transcriptional regulator
VALCGAMSQGDPILDAARATVLDFGVGRATVSEVARRAGVSRMTVYRRHPDGAALLRALMAREFAAVLEQAERETAWLGTGRERLVASAIRCVDLLAVNPVLVRILELDGERLLPYFTGTPGRFQRLAHELLLERVKRCQTGGSVRRSSWRCAASCSPGTPCKPTNVRPRCASWRGCWTATCGPPADV